MRIFLGSRSTLGLLGLLLSFLCITNVHAQFSQLVLPGNPVNTTGWLLGGLSNLGDSPGDVDNLNNEVIICPNQNGVSGSVFYRAQSFNPGICTRWTAEFEFRMFDGTAADGIAFCFLANPPPIQQISGGGCGIPPQPLGLMIVLDTYLNCGGGSVGKLEIRYGDGINNYSECPVPAMPTVTGLALRSTTYQTLRVEYDAGNVDVYLNNVLTASGFQLLNYNGFFGFTASTGGSRDLHSIRNATITIQSPIVNAGSDTTFCTGQPVVLGGSPTASGPGGPSYTYQWVPSIGLDNANIANPTLTLTNGGTAVITRSYRVRVTTSTGCYNDDSVIVRVEPTPNAPTVPPITICTGLPGLLVPTGAPTGGSYALYANPTGGSPITTGTTSLNVSPASTTTFHVETVSAAGCRSATRTAVTVTVVPLPATPTVADATICFQSSAILTPTAPAGVTFNVWTTNNSSGTQLASGVTSFNTGPLASNTAFYFQSVTASGCVSGPPFTQAFVTVSGATAPAAPQNNTSAGNSTICSGAATILSACQNPPLCNISMTYNWYPDTLSTTPLSTNTGTVSTFNTPTLTDTTIYYVQSVNGGCPSGRRTPIRVNVIPSTTPVIQNADVCTTTPPISSANFVVTSPNPLPTGTSFNIFANSVGGAPLTSTSLSGQTITFTPFGGIAATTTFFAEMRVTTPTGTCNSPRVPVSVNFGTVPASPTVFGSTAPTNATRTVCSGQSVTILATAPTTPPLPAGLTFNWYSATDPINPIFTGNPFITPALITNTTYRVEAVTGPQCQSVNRTNVVITVQPALLTPNVTIAPSPVCTGFPATISATWAGPVAVPAANRIYRFYTDSIGGTLLATTTNPGNTFTTGVLINNTSSPRDTSIWVEAGRSDNGCVSVVRRRARITINPSPPNAQIGGIYTVCKGDSVVLVAVPGALAPARYDWYTAATGGSPVFTGNNFVQYNFILDSLVRFVQFTDAAGCVSLQRTRVKVTGLNSPPVPTIADQSICSPTVITYTPTGPAGVNFEWYATATSTSTLAVGNSYTTPAPVSANDSVYVQSVFPSGCSSTRVKSRVFVLPPPSAPTLIVTTPSPICVGNTITVQVQSPIVGVNYRWYTTASGGAPFFTGTSFTSPVTTAPGSYTVYVDAFVPPNCPLNPIRTSATVFINGRPAPSISATGSLTICQGSSVTLNSTTTGIQSYRWLLNGTAIVPNQTASSLIASVAGTYRVAVVGTNGCLDTSNSLVLAVNPNPSITSVTAANSNLCNGATTTLTAAPSGGSGTYTTFSWSPSSAIIAGGNTATPTIQLTNATASPVVVPFSVTVTDNNGCTSTAGNVNVTVYPTPIADAGPATASYCAGNTLQLNGVGSNGQAPYNFQWTPAAGLSNPAIANPVVTQSVTGTYRYYLRVTDARGCQSLRDSIDVTVNPKPSAPFLPVNNICTGVPLTYNGGFGFTSYQWQLNGVNILGATGITFSVTAPGTYSVIVTNASGCRDTSDAPGGQVTISAAPSPNISGINATLPNTNNLIYNTPLVAGHTYQWVASSNLTITTPTTGDNIIVNVGAVSGIDTVFVLETDPFTGCSVRDTFLIQVGSCPSPNILGPATICANTPSVVYQTNAFSGNSYSWTGTAGSSLTIVAGQNTNSITVNINGSGTDTLVVVENSSTPPGCSRFDTLIITVNPRPTRPTFAPNLQFCTGSNLVLDAGPGFASYQWLNSTGGQLGGQVGQTLVVNAPSTYFVEVRNAQGCADTSLAIVVVENALPTIPILPNVNLCQGDSVLLDAGPNGTVYEWLLNGNPVGSNQTFIARIGGAYSVIKRNATGCADTSAPFNVTVNPLPTPNITGPLQVNVNTSGVVYSTPATGNLFNWTATGAVPVGSTTGNSLTVDVGLIGGASLIVRETIVATGCSATDTFVIDVVGCPVPDITGLDTICIGAPAPFAYSTPASGNAFIWRVSAGLVIVGPPPSNTVAIQPVVGSFGGRDTLFLAETDPTSGCVVRDTFIIVSVAPSPAPNISPTTICQGTSILIFVNPLGMVHTYNVFDVASGGTPITTFQDNFQTPILQRDTTWFIEDITTRCPSLRVPMQVFVVPPPTAGVVPDTFGCPGRPLTLTLADTNGIQYDWYTSLTVTAPFFTGPTLNLPSLRDTLFYVRARLGTCPPTAPFLVRAFTFPTADTGFSYSPLNPLIDTVVTFTSPNQAGIIYSWDFADGSSTVRQPNATHAYTREGTFLVRLVAITSDGCTTVTPKVVIVGQLEDRPFVPNVFTPNGDGFNDRWLISGMVNPLKFECVISDRWGRQVASFNNYLDGWDGKVGGSTAPEGVYFYNLNIHLNTGGWYKRTGQLTLLR
jgi:gliding motility-associated-like protein